MSLSAPLPGAQITTAISPTLPPKNALPSSHAGNGAIFFYAGDRVTLTPAGHEVVGSTVSYSNRYLYCYVPMVRRKRGEGMIQVAYYLEIVLHVRERGRGQGCVDQRLAGDVRPTTPLPRRSHSPIAATPSETRSFTAARTR